MPPTGSTRLGIPTGELRIIAGGSVTAVSVTTPHGMAIAFGQSASSDDYYYAQFYDASSSGGTVNLMKADSGVTTSLAGAPYGGKQPTGAWSMQIDESVTAQTLGLTATLGGLAYGPFAATASTPALVGSSELFLGTRNVDVRVDYMLIIETTP
jgi:hypothetical protein